MTLREVFDNHTGRSIQKWDLYLEIYETHFRRFVGRNPNIGEIGVCDGGSLQLWKNYFGVGCRIVGIDINPRCLELADDHTKIFIGSQSDRTFLRKVVAESGPFDIILDDGGHCMVEQIVSFEKLFPATTPNAVYLVEDLHTSYWGNHRKRNKSYAKGGYSAAR